MNIDAYRDLNPPARVLLGPGPSNVHPRVLRAMSMPTIGHLDPEFLKVMDDSMELLRSLFKTANSLTIPVSGTGSAGMEAALVNFVEPGDKVVIGHNGLFGERMIDVARRCGADVVPVTADWGQIIEPDAIKAALNGNARVKLVCLVHAETSTGAWQPLEEIGRLARAHDALFLVDTVTSLAGCDVQVDNWGIDICYSGTQKCLSCPPGLAPLTVGERAIRALEARKTKVQSWYLDLSMVRQYWGSGRLYHHTAPVNMIYAFRESLRLIHEEGLDNRFARHRLYGDALQAGLKAMGMELYAQEGHRLPVLTAVRIPEGVEDLKVRQTLLSEFGIEIGGGLGPLKGKAWRIGLMGYSSTEPNLVLLLTALEAVLPRFGFKVEGGSGPAAAVDSIRQSGPA
ncbi:MAG: alanine--glyoxylate aminotransferase family protein [Dehalococcoidia bacterium]|nr:alanine--glyoxylate aminotransferase family protein [Dehalococcoidia bacterium]